MTNTAVTQHDSENCAGPQVMIVGPDWGIKCVCLAQKVLHLPRLRVSQRQSRADTRLNSVVETSDSGTTGGALTSDLSVSGNQEPLFWRQADLSDVSVSLWQKAWGSHELRAANQWHSALCKLRRWHKIQTPAKKLNSPVDCQHVWRPDVFPMTRCLFGQ